MKKELLELLKENKMGYSLLHHLENGDEMLSLSIWYLGTSYNEHGLLINCLISKDRNHEQSLNIACDEAIEYLNSDSFVSNFLKNEQYQKTIKK